MNKNTIKLTLDRQVYGKFGTLSGEVTLEDDDKGEASEYAKKLMAAGFATKGHAAKEKAPAKKAPAK